jgi:lichenan operon transcriptional antiterminator
MAKIMNLSESTIRDLIKEINLNSRTYGIEIQLQKGRGYTAKIRDENLWVQYLRNHPEEVDIYNSNQRIEMLLFYILQANNYITIGNLMERMMLSRSTITRDLEAVEKVLEGLNLKLTRKAHHGLSIEGSEQNYRKAISKFVLNSSLYLEPAKNYKNFLDTIQPGELEKILSDVLSETALKISDVAFENILTHLKVLLFRVKHHNFITKAQFLNTKIDTQFYTVAERIGVWIQERFDIVLPPDEIHFLAAHISTRTNSTIDDMKEREVLHSELGAILTTLDSEFMTQFQDDADLIEALMMHMYPLLKRLYFNLQLENPLIEEIYINYTNVFVVSYTFAELIRKTYGFELTRDEIGYIALHFAAHFERVNNQYIEKIKRIVVICSTGGGSANLIRIKLENIFPKAHIVTTSQFNMSQFANELPDLFLSTIPMQDEFQNIPVLHIKQFLDEVEIRRIKEITALHVANTPVAPHQILGLKSLFLMDLFIKTDGKDYLEIIRNQAALMVEKGYTSEDFLDLVLEREEKMPTIYKNGIAGPHPMKLNGKVDSIGVTILESPIEWKGRTVQIIFLINLMQGHLFVHKEISHLLLYYIENDDARERLLRCSTFEGFLDEIEKTIT